MWLKCYFDATEIQLWMDGNGDVNVDGNIWYKWRGSDPVRIKSPPELADQTVEERLITFDWDKNFHSFQETTRRGAFRPLCWVKTQALIDVSNPSSLICITSTPIPLRNPITTLAHQHGNAASTSLIQFNPIQSNSIQFNPIQSKRRDRQHRITTPPTWPEANQNRAFACRGARSPRGYPASNIRTANPADPIRTTATAPPPPPPPPQQQHQQQQHQPPQPPQPQPKNPQQRLQRHLSSPFGVRASRWTTRRAMTPCRTWPTTLPHRKRPARSWAVGRAPQGRQPRRCPRPRPLSWPSSLPWRHLAPTLSNFYKSSITVIIARYYYYYYYYHYHYQSNQPLPPAPPPFPPPSTKKK